MLATENQAVATHLGEQQRRSTYAQPTTRAQRSATAGRNRLKSYKYLVRQAKKRPG